MTRTILTVLTGIFLLICSQGLWAQQDNVALRKAYAKPEEIVSFSRSTSFRQVMLILNELSQKFMGKVIIDPENRNTAIDVDIDKMHWLTALELILRTKGLWYEEKPTYLQIFAVKDGPQKQELSKETLAAKEKFEAREVVISALFFEADDAKLRQAGMSWSFTRNDDLKPTVTNLSADDVGGLFEFKVEPSGDFGDLTAVFKALETDQVGEVVANPQVTVRSGEEGRIQVGSDISVTLQDFAGNAVTQFFSTGSIIKVEPEVVTYDSIEFIHIDLEIERSSSSSGEAGLEIAKSRAETTIMLLDGEETLIGGLYINEESTTRNGVPFLKDLPWWFFGLRYVFGFESQNRIKKELLILIKAEMLPTIKERFQQKLRGTNKRNVLTDERRKARKQFKEYDLQKERGARDLKPATRTTQRRRNR